MALIIPCHSMLSCLRPLYPFPVPRSFRTHTPTDQCLSRRPIHFELPWTYPTNMMQLSCPVPLVFSSHVDFRQCPSCRASGPCLSRLQCSKLPGPHSLRVHGIASSPTTPDFDVAPASTESSSPRRLPSTISRSWETGVVLSLCSPVMPNLADAVVVTSNPGLTPQTASALLSCSKLEQSILLLPTDLMSPLGFAPTLKKTANGMGLLMGP
ncbi:hypothetical protein SODALDRAFT_358496 [Sodiomyces alkalinus F11]|uniref:Uncharacterized protein n=1 Tax=Sodiomyces alkalinus (strain CBS 110278 / VKM F-3762 / F11) TaxID=1314773 RepID=A0A3N2PZX1_SODAK|nr:hypothetical protein SODALDRAFT_358496 [Sodiomyces alkalinus F11]ROT40071.1 hypothetical protein SODALDRAFT_358496 [Sodiomyces alkalinus F11]